MRHSPLRRRARAWFIKLVVVAEEPEGMQFQRSLYDRLPQPLAAAYHKAYNSASSKELHDNALHFGLCLMRFLAMLAVSLVRDCHCQLEDKDAGLVTDLDRASEGHWRQLLVRSLLRLRAARVEPDSLGGELDNYLSSKRPVARSGLAVALSELMSYLQQKTITRSSASVHEFFETLVEYRNKALGHNVVLPEAINQQHGTLLLESTQELAELDGLWDEWELKYVSEATIDAEGVACRCVNLTGPAWLREPPRQLPPGVALPPRAHVILAARSGPPPFVDLHPLLVFRDGRVCLLNGAARRQPAYQDYASSEQLKIAELAEDYANWKQQLVAGGLPAEASTPASATSAAEALPELSAARFRFERLLGRGGMGEVWLGYDEMLRRRVALKRVHRELVHQPELYRRMLQEARDVAQLNHPNIVSILSIENDEESLFLVLELMEGGSLRQLLSKGAMPLRDALNYLRQLLQALQYAHEQGVVHRDIKPENILLTRSGVPKLADFGLAWLLENQDPEDEAQQSGNFAEGTRNYVAPELRKGYDRPSPRTDLFSLGITLYEMLTGLPPQPQRSDKVPSVAQPLLQKLSCKDPNLRYDQASAALSDCLQLQRALELAGHTEAETRSRRQQTLRQACQALRDGKLIDARSGLERLLAEQPDDEAALAAMLVQRLIEADLAEAARLYARLQKTESQDPLLQRTLKFLQGIPRPAALIVQALPMPFSYQRDELSQQRRLIKDLVPWEAQTVNLGDIGEALVELVQRTAPAAVLSFDMPAADACRLTIPLAAVQVTAEYRFTIRSAWLFRPVQLQGIATRLTLDGDPFEIYRLARYLRQLLEQRFRRTLDEWTTSSAAEAFRTSAEEARKSWHNLQLPINEILTFEN